ncbi:MAG: hypothetical protein ACHQT6_13010, partial [Candidatus Acidiferrales bacterium]
MGNSFDISVERLVGAGVPVPRLLLARPPHPGCEERASDGGPYTDERALAGTFYLETFGCQMNDHDSEKVAGVLLARGY